MRNVFFDTKSTFLYIESIITCNTCSTLSQNIFKIKESDIFNNILGISISFQTNVK